MKTIKFIALFFSISIITAPASEIVETANANEPFEVIKVENNSVTFKALKETSIYSVAFVSGDKTVLTGRISSTAGDMKLPNGATATEGSSLLMPKEGGPVSLLYLMKGTVVKCEIEKLTEELSADKIKFMITKDATPFYYNIQSKMWE